ncbi:MAG: tryptophan 2,3-dioxygenase [Planctomycetota bacterium]|nr:tryptophan 2,3-dioxygenase [Planctomycetota bacterium]
MSGDDHHRYEAYLRLDRILDAQLPPDADWKPRPHAHHDEMLFIVVHQAYELWFKQVLHEVVRGRDLLMADPVPEEHIPRVCKSLRRVHEIEKVMIAQLSVLETMSPGDFLAFRDSLGNASGFQSAQFRTLEILCGLPDEQRYAYQGKSFERRFPRDTVDRFDALRAEPNLRDVLYRWLARTPIEDGWTEAYLAAFNSYVAEQVRLHGANRELNDEERAVTLERLEQYRRSCQEFFTGDDAAAHAACMFVTAYKEQPLLHWPNRLLDSLLEFEELWRMWRFRHARMVERMIGLRLGTGGSSGVEYLDKTAGERYRIFTVILQCRSFLLPPRLVPHLRDPERYGFVMES